MMTDDSREGQELGMPNFYTQDPLSSDNMRYRLDGNDVIEGVIDIIKGYSHTNNNNEKVYDPNMRMMNDLGIQAVRMSIALCVNKVNHLTKYKDDDMIKRQLRSIFKRWQFDLTKNKKLWAPETIQVGKEWIIAEGKKVRNDGLITQMVENPNLQSSLRGADGFEAQLTGKAYSVQEFHDRRGEEQDSSRSKWIPSFFGGRR